MELSLWCTVICAHALLMFRRRHGDQLKISKGAENVFHMFHLICTVNYSKYTERKRPSPIAHTNSRKKMAQPTDFKQINYFDAATFPAGTFEFLNPTQPSTTRKEIG